MHAMLNIAIKAARRAGCIINRASLDLKRIQVFRKQHNNYVTEVDRSAEAAIIETLNQAFPDHSILAEESGIIDRGSDYVWMIDPIDGTTNFMRGFPYYCISIALLIKNTIEHAVVYDPNRNDLFTASRGSGAFLNARRIRVTRRDRLSESLISTGFPYKPYQGKYIIKKYLSLFEEMTYACAGIRRPGAAALDLANVATGRIDGFFEQGLKPWDMAAGCLLILEAGGLVGNYIGDSNFMDLGEIATGNPKIFAQMIPILRNYSLANKSISVENTSFKEPQ